MSRELKEKSIRWLLTGVAFVSLLSLACIMLFLFMEGLPLFADYPLWDFLTGHLWYPTSEPPEFGIFPLIMGSLAVTILASCIAVPLCIMTAAYLAEIAASRTRRIVKPFVELLAALPSVVIGFFGMVIVAPFLQDWFGADTGLNLLNAALMLARSGVRRFLLVAHDTVDASNLNRQQFMPRDVGRPKAEALRDRLLELDPELDVVIPSALSGIGTAVMLGMSRAIGETMVVLMVAGGAAIIPLSIFDPVRPMPASIAAEMAEAPFRGDHYFALFATGIVLFLFTLLFNMLAFRIAEKHKQTGSSGL